MRIKSHTFDPEADAAYGYLLESQVAETDEVAPGIIVDWDKDGRPIGIELLSVSRRLGASDLESYLNGLAEGLFAARLDDQAEAAE